MPALSFISLAIWDPQAGGSQKPVTRMGRKTSHLVFNSTFKFEPLKLPGSCPMKTRGVLYYPSPTPIRYVALSPIFWGACCVPLMPLFLGCNTTPTIRDQLHHLQSSKFPHCCAGQCRRLQRVRQEGEQRLLVRQWLSLWEFGRGKPRLGGLSLAETEELRIAVMQWGYV